MQWLTTEFKYQDRDTITVTMLDAMLNNVWHMRFEVLTAVLLKNSVFWYVTSCWLVKCLLSSDCLTLTMVALQYLRTWVTSHLPIHMVKQPRRLAPSNVWHESQYRMNSTGCMQLQLNAMRKIVLSIMTWTCLKCSTTAEILVFNSILQFGHEEAEMQVT